MALWRERQKQHRENFEAAANLASTAFETARTSLDSGMAEIAVKIASERIAANLEAKMKSVNKLA